jgi:hypothetical protein
MADYAILGVSLKDICGFALIGLGIIALAVLKRPIVGPSLIITGILVIIS